MTVRPPAAMTLIVDVAGTSPATTHLCAVMPALVAGIHAFLAGQQEDVDGRDKPGHDSGQI
jgi:hypothetical protein